MRTRGQAAQVAAGEPLTEADRLALDRTIRIAEQSSRFEFSVYVGPAQGDDTRAWATRLHNRLVAPARSVMVIVDPRRRVIEVVTGGDVRRHLSDAEVELAVLAMSSEFASGNLLAGLQRGITMLAEHARPQNTLHA
ncbi:TLP18.3, Psb32 and MOLO-1 founding protein of phosphatase [Nocardioides exalbidus]|uniref:TLP18.3, Psb32 and MOLO-1 founding protein of phosphatase n=1 Tax=Nocardioides exalbidus TaxID=402596 RepID=A0A1H4JHX8_9ACTN|nr:TLP18.3, Psb32 and MOLO-1 founding protein of phosphatase [Nocardioides exalbidus]